MLTRTEIETILDIAERATALYMRLGIKLDGTFPELSVRAGIAYEVMTVHRDIIPLRLQEFLDSDDVNFAHDIGGIHHHLDDASTPPRLTDCFLPRFANVGV